MSVLDLGILGLGNIGTVHLQSAQRLPDVRVRAVADAIPENRTLARKLGVSRTYTDYEELCEEESLDAVVVALPPFLHADAVEAAAEQGFDVFVEKPFATSHEEATRMVDIAREAGVALGVDHTIRYQPGIRRMKSEYDAGHIGHVPLATISRINNGPFSAPPAERSLPGWQFDPSATGGGALMDLGVHLFDVLEWFFGDLSVEHATMDRQLDLEFEDTASVVVRATETGTTATLNCGFFQWEEPPNVNMRFQLDGVADSLENSSFAPSSFPVHAAKSASKNVLKRLRGDDPDYFGPTYYYRAHYDALGAFCEASAAGEEPPVNGETGRRMVGLVEDAYAAADFDPGR